MSSGIDRPRAQRGRPFTLLAVALLCGACLPRAYAGPYVPRSDSEVLAEILDGLSAWIDTVAVSSP